MRDWHDAETGEQVERLTILQWKNQKDPNPTELTSFPPPISNRLQYPNTEGEAWEIWLRRLISGGLGQMGGGVQRRLPKPLLACNVSLRAGGQSIHKAARIL